MSPYTAEFIGTALLILLGDGVVANVVLNRSKGQSAGWMAIATGWGLGAAVAIYASAPFSGAHLNPAVTLGLFAIGKFEAGKVVGYILAQLLGAFVGAILVWLAYLPHWGETPDPASKLAVFCTNPAMKHHKLNLITEIIGSFVLVLGVLAILSPQNMIPESGIGKGMGPLLVGVLIWSIGLSLGGPTGYAINPARDLGPRLAHYFLPIAGKGGSDWGYAWVPIFGPIIGGILGAVVYKSLWPA